jgi:uncharacterized protein YbjT (DUF2867 family)
LFAGGGVSADCDAVTGALGYTGRYITRRLLSAGRRVRSLTGHLDRPNPFGDRVSVAPLDFERRAALVESLRGTTTLFNTYWVRFPRGALTYEVAVRNSTALFEAAREAGVERVVHVSIANPSLDSPLGYYRGKAEVEKALVESRLSHAILRPTVIYGSEDILINNIAWMLRRLPVFGVPGSGQYRIQPIGVEDMAELAVDAAKRRDDFVIDAVGPEVYAFEDLVRRIAKSIGSRARMVRVPPGVALMAARLIGAVVGDVVLTAEEIRGLMADLLVSKGPPTGRARLSEWLDQHSATVGAHYASELARHYR